MSVGVVTEYLGTVGGADGAALERVYAVARQLVPDAEEGTSYGMAALIYRGKGLIATLQTKKFLSLYPFSGAVVASVVDDLPGFEATSGSIHYSAEHPLPDDVLRRIIQARRAEIDARLG
jgi:uncharacterized protein YdhG (YjbR/CyaY superfamily)